MEVMKMLTIAIAMTSDIIWRNDLRPQLWQVYYEHSIDCL